MPDTDTMIGVPSKMNSVYNIEDYYRLKIKHQLKHITKCYRKYKSGNTNKTGKNNLKMVTERNWLMVEQNKENFSSLAKMKRVMDVANIIKQSNTGEDKYFGFVLNDSVYMNLDFFEFFGDKHTNYRQKARDVYDRGRVEKMTVSNVDIHYVMHTIESAPASKLYPVMVSWHHTRDHIGILLQYIPDFIR